IFRPWFKGRSLGKVTLGGCRVNPGSIDVDCGLGTIAFVITRWDLDRERRQWLLCIDQWICCQRWRHRRVRPRGDILLVFLSRDVVCALRILSRSLLILYILIIP